MKKYFSLAAIALLSMTGCSEKFDVAAPYKDITVVYGFLDMADTAHYIRIQKAFLDQNKSGVDMAKTADSSFYANLSVRIERYNIGGTNAYHDSIHLNRVDLTAEGYPKQPGAFFEAPNYAYKFTDVLDPQYFYRLKVTNLTTGQVDSADAPILTNKTPTFNVPIIDDQSFNLAGMSFFSALPRREFTLEGIYYTPPGYSFHNETTPIGIAQAIIRFNWIDSDISTHSRTPRSYDFDAGFTNTVNGAFSYKIENLDLYNALAIGMGKAPDNIVRLIDRCDITVYLGTHDFYSYQQAIQLQGNGLTGNEIAPTYTNIKGNDPLGLFTSRALQTGKVTITNRTVDSLLISPILAGTKLQGTAY